jgi:CubicO group peptidase (beta-lactamase class C family)
MSSERLNKLTATLKADVDKGVIPGAVVLVARHGKVALLEAVGARNPESKAPMTKDSIFRIYSMSKPITSVAAMMLFEDGKFTLAEPVSKYIPQLGGLKVGVEKPDASGKSALELVPVQRDMTIHDLFRHTSGLTYGFFGNTRVKKMYVDTKVWNDYPSNAELVTRLAKMPLAYQPGTTWDYSHSTDVLGRLIEVITRQTLYQYETERVLDPLGMKDTSFYVTDTSKQDRIVEPFTLDGKRILGPRTIAYMTADHLGTSINPGPLYLPGAGFGFGLGFAVRKDAGVSPFIGSVGEVNWGGAGGTYFWIDPKEDLFVVFMMQSPKQRVPYRYVLKDMVYAAITKPAAR